ncbi:MAG: HD domain-containing phosphohydrolase [Candidatus Krumholzibacteriia bacterium]
MTAAYVSLDDVLGAAGSGENPTVLAEALSILLDAHDLAAEAVVCVRQGDHLESSDGVWRLPVAGGITETVLRVRRPLTMIDVQDGDLWDEESQFLEDLRPDLILPLLRGDDLMGVACLRRSGEERDYNLAEVFALEMLQRLLAQAAGDPAPAASASSETPTAPAGRMVALPASNDREVLLGVKLDLARGLQDAQDVPHFWQVFIARLRLAASVSSLLYVDTADGSNALFAAGEARRHEEAFDLGNERLRLFFRTLERPVEIENMPASFAAVRDQLLARGLQWLVSLRVEDECLGMVALSLDWSCRSLEPTDEIHGIMEIAAEALQRLRDGQRRANMNLGLLESLLVGDDHGAPDRITRETATAVRRLARELGLPPDQERDLVLGALLRNVAQEPGTADDLDADHLTGDEWERFRAHPEAGDRHMAALDAPAAVRNAIRHHHERFDGRGFPLGLAGRDIPLMARLVALAQLYALVLVREGRTIATNTLRAEAGRALDPDLTEIFLKSLRRGDQPREAEDVIAV